MIVFCSCMQPTKLMHLCVTHYDNTNTLRKYFKETGAFKVHLLLHFKTNKSAFKNEIKLLFYFLNEGCQYTGDIKKCKGENTVKVYEMAK